MLNMRAKFCPSKQQLFNAIKGCPPKENSLSRQNIIEAAIACIDRDDESVLEVNRVAKLGIKPPAICKYLKGNTELRR